jgi:histidine triad (HIT) family protein
MNQTNNMNKTIFQRIIDREIPAKIEHEDERCIVIHDIQPQAPVHLLVVPKGVIARVAAASAGDEGVLGHLIVVAGMVAGRLGLERGFRLVINNGPDACESVPHVHVHLLAGRQLGWPPG